MQESFERIETDILVIGGGGAGLMAVLHAIRADPRLRITVAVKGLVGQSGCTRMVQGGYNAVLDPADSLELHFRDTIEGGVYLNDQELAWALVSGAAGVIEELEGYGCRFDRTPDGRIHQKAFAGQSFDRTVHRSDLTGIEIMTWLQDATLASGVDVLGEHRAVNLFRAGNGAVAGALLLDIRRGRFVAVSAKAVLVAAGGGARMFRISAPSLEKTGDGMAICYRAGCVMQDMEMYQFHPTGIIAGQSVITGAVLEEGLRGAGGYLKNVQGERFMARYDPERMERSTRDVVARAAYMEIREGRGTDDGAVFIDVSHLGAEFVERTFPGMTDRCREVGYDLARGPVKVSPTAHFHMGGARISLDCRTNLEGLFVAGEDAGGVHGANRLGGNGVAESTVFGARAGDAMAAYVTSVASVQGEGVARSPESEVPDSQVMEAIASHSEPFRMAGSENVFQVREDIEDAMWDGAGLVRDRSGLESTLAIIDGCAERLGNVTIPAVKESNQAWQEWLDVQNILDVARLTCESALARTESRGSHFRSDHPERDDGRWLRNVLVQRADDDERPRIWDEPVKFTRLGPP